MSPFALAAAFFFALGLVLQEKAASEQPDETVGAGFLVRLVRQPIWLLGLAMQGVGFVAQAIAVGVGRMVVVQPLLVASIVFALPLGRLIEKRTIERAEWIGAAMVTGGLAVLLITSKPAAGDDDASLLAWAVIGGGAAGVAVVLFVLAKGRRPEVRAGLLGTASGILFGLGAALTKTAVSLLDDGIGAVFGDWHVYALVLVSIAAFWLEQAPLPLFDEALHEGLLGYVAAAALLGVTLCGLVVLVRAKGAKPPPELAPVPAPA